MQTFGRRSLTAGVGRQMACGALLGVIAATTPLLACTPTTVDSTVEGSPSPDAEVADAGTDTSTEPEPGASALADRTAYEAIELPPDGIRPGQEDLTPLMVAQEYMAEPAEEECFRWQQVRLEKFDDAMTAVVSTKMGFCDDSLGGVEYRYDLERVGNQYIIDWGGVRNYCTRTSPPGWAEPGTSCL